MPAAAGVALRSTRSPTSASLSRGLEVDTFLPVEPNQRAVSRITAVENYRAAERLLASVEVTADKSVVAASDGNL